MDKDSFVVRMWAERMKVGVINIKLFFGW
jgi:hypothetical protein